VLCPWLPFKPQHLAQLSAQLADIEVIGPEAAPVHLQCLGVERVGKLPPT